METRSPNGKQACVTVRVPFAASSAAIARQQLEAWMRAQACPRESVEDARVIISELVGNSVRHALPLPDGTIVLTWGRFGPGIGISVTDGGSPSHPHKMNASTSAVSGRGIAIVETLALDWWTEQSRARSTIHTVLRP